MAVRGGAYLIEWPLGWALIRGNTVSQKRWLATTLEKSFCSVVFIFSLLSTGKGFSLEKTCSRTLFFKST